MPIKSGMKELSKPNKTRRTPSLVKKLISRLKLLELLQRSQRKDLKLSRTRRSSFN